MNSRWDALAQIGLCINDAYTCKRIHSSLGCLTPPENEMQWEGIRPEAELIAVVGIVATLHPILNSIDQSSPWGSSASAFWMPWV